MTTSTRSGLAEDIVISIVIFLVVSLRNTDGTGFQGANSHGDIHAAVFGSPFVKDCRADAQLGAYVWNADTSLNAFERVQNLADTEF